MVDRSPVMGRVVMDYPTAWAFVADTALVDHDPRCSYAQTNRALLCDCHVLTDEYVRRANAAER